MTGEFYVVNAVRASDESWHRVAECLGLDPSLNRETVIFALSQRDRMWRFMSRYQCTWVEVFQELRRVLDREVAGTDTGDEPDPDLLTEPDAQRVLGQLLDCSGREALGRVFASADLRKLILDSGIARQRDRLSNDVDWLLSVLLAESARSRLTDVLATGDVWELLHGLVNESARRQLADALGCPEDDVLRVVARRVKEMARPMRAVTDAEQFGAAGGLDTVALSKFRVFLHLFRYHLLQEAKSHAHRAKARLPGRLQPAMVPSVIEFYLLGDFRSALNDLLRSQETLRRLCAQQTMHSGGDFPADARLEAVESSEEPGKLLSIWCVREPGGQRTEILRLTAPDRARLLHLKSHVPAMVRECPSTGSSLAERILNTPLPAYDPWRRLLRNALGNADTIDDEFIQALVLSGIALRPLPSELTMFATDRPAPQRPEAHVSFPSGACAIAAQLRSAYAKEERKLITIPQPSGTAAPRPTTR